MIELLQKLFSGVFKDEKTRTIFIIISFALYVVWGEWRKEVSTNDTFVLSELKECRLNYENCQNQMKLISENMRTTIDSINKSNLETKAEVKYLSDVIDRYLKGM